MRRFRRTTLLAVVCSSILIGLGLARKIQIDFSLFWLLLPALLILRRKNYAALLACVLIGLSVGLWRGDQYMGKLNELRALSGQKVVINATATSDAIYSTASQLEFSAAQASSDSGQPLAGNFKISGFGEPMIYRGDHVQISGKLYPTRGSNQARISYAQLKRVGLNNSWVNRFTRRLSAGMQSALPEPNASFGLGLLIGQRNSLPSNLTNQLIVVGLVHIVAVSGYNLTILVRAVSRLRLGSKYQRLVVSLGLIGMFILMTGFSASIVRAGLVSTLALLAWYYGRKFLPVLLIGLTAAITGLANPFYVWGDLSWYLSFLAFFGVMVLAPALSRRLFSSQPKLITLVVLETLCAEIMTLPLILLSFSQLSLIGLVANALVAPLIPLAMLLSTLAAAAGMWIPSLAGWIAWPANLLLTYILDVVRLLASIPGIFLHRSIGTGSMIYVYGLVLLVAAGFHKQVGKLRNNQLN